MSWRDNLQKASFRGIPFKVSASELSTGRKFQIEEIASTSGASGDNATAADKKAVETYASQQKGNVKKPDNKLYTDIGFYVDEFKIEGYVIQNALNSFDYFAERDALITALKSAGRGELVHPYYGKINVVLKEAATISESYDEGGIARFSMTFVKSVRSISISSTDWNAMIDKSVLSTLNSALDTFARWMNTAGAFVNSIVAPYNKTMGKLVTAIQSIKGAVSSVVSAALSVVTTATTLISSVLDAPCDLANLLKDSYESVKGVVGMAGDVISQADIGSCSGEERGNTETLDGTSIPANLGTSIMDSILDNCTGVEDTDLGLVPIEQEDNITLTNDVAQAMALCMVATIAIRTVYDSIDSMLKYLIKIQEAFDLLLLKLGEAPDTIDNTLLYNSIEDLRATLSAGMLDKFSGLAKEIDYEVPTDLISTLQLSYDKYYNLEMDADIFNRNYKLIKHPGFLPNGENIRILNE